MEKQHKSLLRCNRVTLAKELDISEICQYLVEDGILSDRMVEEIASKRTTFDRNVAFLNKLPGRGPKAFDALYNALVETEQSHLAQLLTPNRTPFMVNDESAHAIPLSSFSVLPTSPLTKSTPKKRHHADITPDPSIFDISGMSGKSLRSCTKKTVECPAAVQNCTQEEHCSTVYGDSSERSPVENMDTSSSGENSPDIATSRDESNNLESLRSNRSLESLHSIAGILPLTSKNTTAKIMKINHTSSENHNASAIAQSNHGDGMLVSDSPTTAHVTVRNSSPEFLVEKAVDCYPMFGACKGLALIINVERFEPSACLDERAGAEKDCARMELLLKQLSYEVYLLKNGTASEIWNTMKNFAAWSKLGEADSCFIVLMSHGEDGVIYGKDGKPLPLQEAFDLYSNANCPYLQNKPKIFLVQACRGEDPDKGVDQIDGPTREVLKPATHARINEGIIRNKLPTMSDCVFAYATVPGYAAMRNTCNGSWFIQAFIQIVAFHARDKSLLEIMTLTNNQVKGREGWSPSSEFHRCKEMSEFRSCLCKPLYFFPGLCVTDTPADAPL